MNLGYLLDSKIWHELDAETRSEWIQEDVAMRLKVLANLLENRDPDARISVLRAVSDIAKHTQDSSSLSISSKRAKAYSEEDLMEILLFLREIGSDPDLVLDEEYVKGKVKMVDEKLDEPIHQFKLEKADFSRRGVPITDRAAE